MDLNSFNILGKRVIVTGGARGIGAEMCRTLSRAGAAVSIFDINVKQAKEVANGIKNAHTQALAFEVDVRNPEQIAYAVSKTVEILGGVDILINDAGVTGHAPLTDMSLAEWRKVIDTNLTGTFLCSQAAAKYMIQSGKGGKIINISSMSAFIVNRGSNNAHYCSSKAGVSQFTKSAACEWAQYGIRVNALAPGYFATEMAMEAALKYPEIRKSIEDSIPLGRVAQPEEIGGIVLFLCSNASDYLTGTTILIDGGYTCW